MCMQGVHCIAYSPLGHSDPSVINNDVLQEVAQDLGRTSAQVNSQSLLPLQQQHACLYCHLGFVSLMLFAPFQRLASTPCSLHLFASFPLPPPLHILPSPQPLPQPLPLVKQLARTVPVVTSTGLFNLVFRMRGILQLGTEQWLVVNLSGLCYALGLHAKLSVLLLAMMCHVCNCRSA